MAMPSLRILALSDIHGNIGVVRRLRAQELNAFDLVVVAGDIGSVGGDRAGEVLSVLATFGCPVLYVLGNHDSQVPYDRDFGPACFHLHHRVFEQQGVAFVGYSGLPANWGQNPEAAEVEAEAVRRHAAVKASAAELDEAQEAEVARIDAEATERLAHLHAEVGDRRAKAYRDGAAAIASSRKRRTHAAGEAGRQLRATDAWLHKEWDERNFDTKAIAANRAAVARTAYALDPRRCVGVTHERQTRTSFDMPHVPLFLFGHAHGYSDKTFKGSRFVNVSALDDRVISPFGAGPEAGARMGTYTVMEIRDDITCVCRRLMSDKPNIPQ